MLTVDGDTSTNDTVLLTATGKSQRQVGGFPGSFAVCLHGAGAQMARDGKGASKYFETVVCGARSVEDARLAAKAVARSSLVKTRFTVPIPTGGRIVQWDTRAQRWTRNHTGPYMEGKSGLKIWWRRAASWMEFWIRPRR